MQTLLGSGLGRTKLHMLDDGVVIARVRVREGPSPYHRIVVTPVDDAASWTVEGLPREVVSTEMYADTGVTLADVVEGYIRAHRTPKRLKRWELQKAATAEAERLEMDTARER